MDNPELISVPPEPLDSGLRALCGIAAFYRIAADPRHLANELALTGRLADERDLIRAAAMIGLKARVVGKLTAKRIETLPVPAIVRVADGSFQVFGGKNPSGRFRLVDPVTRVDRELTVEVLLRETGGEIVLIGRRLRGQGSDPRSFGLAFRANL